MNRNIDELKAKYAMLEGYNVELLDDNWALVVNKNGCIWFNHLCDGLFRAIVDASETCTGSNGYYCRYCMDKISCDEQSIDTSKYKLPKAYETLLHSHLSTCKDCSIMSALSRTKNSDNTYIRSVISLANEALQKKSK